MRKANSGSFKKGQKSSLFKDETGNRYGKLTVLGRSTDRSHGYAAWRCQCDCGNIVDRQGTHLRYGSNHSCIGGSRCGKILPKKYQNQSKQRRWLRFYKAYDILEEDFNCIWQAFRGKCGICARSLVHPDDSKRRTPDSCCLDHNHKTGRLRGLLCNSCNKGIGLLQDSVELLENAVKYLK